MNELTPEWKATLPLKTPELRKGTNGFNGSRTILKSYHFRNRLTQKKQTLVKKIESSKKRGKVQKTRTRFVLLVFLPLSFSQYFRSRSCNSNEGDGSMEDMESEQRYGLSTFVFQSCINESSTVAILLTSDIKVPAEKELRQLSGSLFGYSPLQTPSPTKYTPIRTPTSPVSNASTMWVYLDSDIYPLPLNSCI